MNNEEKNKIAKENESETKSALEQARRQQEEDIRNGQKPIINSLAESIGEKLVDKYGKESNE